VVAAVATSGALTACNRTSPANGAEGPTSGPALHAETMIHRGINNIATTSELAVIGTIQEIRPLVTIAYPNPGGEGVRTTYRQRTVRDVLILVERVVFDSPGVTATTGQTITLTVEPNEERTITASGCTVDDVVGPLAVGERQLLLLRHFSDFPTPEGARRDILALDAAWQAHWQIEGEVAKSVCARRTVPVVALLNRIEAERQNGREPARDPGTEENPLAPPGSARPGGN
jgi:hypothetical protein